MDYTTIIRKNLKNTLEVTDFPGLGKRLKGKVRDVYVQDDKIFFITTDRQSAFDRNLALIPFKGQVLTQASAFWFDATRDIVPNHFLSLPDPNVMVCRKCRIFPVEFVVRGYLTGVTATAAWTAYEKGEREFCGNILPDGMVKNQAFASPLLTPTTKSDEHDEKISPREIVERSLMTAPEWEEAARISLALFRRGQEIAARNNLILVDTKYELGTDETGRIVLCDEVHTPDSSRFWIRDSYAERFARGVEPENIDKEFLRLWFKEHCDPYKDEVLPEAPEDLVVELSRRYIQLYEMITGKKFDFGGELVAERIRGNLKKENYLS
jgi:phosphoribosylaminoimidazole-succinocarboxamide synthase